MQYQPKKSISLRPHHILCTVGFQGMGYSPTFVQNYDKIVYTLKQDAQTSIHITTKGDAICAACPHLASDGGCTTPQIIQKLDKAHSDILEIQEGDTLTWVEALQKVREKMTFDAFHHACAPCQWKSYGVCESALKTLLSSSKV